MPLFSFFNLLTETTVNCRCPLQSLNWGYCKEKNAKSGFVKDIPWCPSPLVTSSTTCVCLLLWEQTGGQVTNRRRRMQAVKHMERPCPGQVPLPCCNARNVTVRKWHCPNRWELYPRSFLLQQFNLDSKILMMKELFYNFSCCMRGEWSHRRWLWRGGIM